MSRRCFQILLLGAMLVLVAGNVPAYATDDSGNTADSTTVSLTPGQDRPISAADTTSPALETETESVSELGDGEDEGASNGFFSQYLLPVLVTVAIGVATYLLYTVRSS